MSDRGEEVRSTAAAEVARHLVALRGGGLFLSPQDAALLDTWLKSGVSVPAVVGAVHRLVEARARRPSHLPITLRAARRYLKKVGNYSGTAGDSVLGQFTGLVAEIRKKARGDVRSEALMVMADRLEELPDADPVLARERAQGLVRDFLLLAWDALPTWEREARLTTAREELGELAGVLDPAALQESLEEIARGELRRGYLWLVREVFQE